MRYLVPLSLAALAALALACKGSTDDGPGYDRVVGRFCLKSQVSTAVLNGSDWNVTLFGDKTEHRNVTDSKGFVRDQEVRSCVKAICHITNGASSYHTAEQAIAACESEQGWVNGEPSARRRRA